MQDAIHQYWAQLVTFGAVIAAFVRSEFRGRNNTREIEKLELRIEKQRLEDRQTARDEMHSIKEMLAELRSDVKSLLQRP
jgi:hypothetical protein